jgi:hypothetical protein
VQVTKYRQISQETTHHTNEVESKMETCGLQKNVPFFLIKQASIPILLALKVLAGTLKLQSIFSSPVLLLPLHILSSWRGAQLKAQG